MLRLMSDLVPGAGCRARRRAEEFRSALVSGRRAHRRDGGEGISRRIPERIRDRRPRRRRRRSTGSRFFTPAPRRTARASSPMAGGCSMCRALGRSVAEAQSRAYAAVDRIRWPEGFCRRDIGFRAMERERAVDRMADRRCDAGPCPISPISIRASPRAGSIHRSARIFARVGGDRAAALLLHGYAQTNVIWHRVAPVLAQRFTLVIADLPGYGWSAVPRGGRGSFALHQARHGGGHDRGDGGARLRALSSRRA